MKRAIMLAASAGVLFALSAQAASTAQLPQRAPGKWKLTTEMNQGNQSIKQSLTMCISAEMEKKTAEASAAEHQSSCSRYDISEENGATIIESSCAYAVDKVTSRTEMTGDFKKSFAVKIVSTTMTQPPGGLKPIRRDRTINQTGEYLGKDCGDIQPGEAVSEDGSRVIVQ